MLQRERPRKVRLGIELEADALLSISGAQAYSIALKRAEEASSDEMARGWSVVAATVARKSGVRSSLLDAAPTGLCDDAPAFGSRALFLIALCSRRSRWRVPRTSVDLNCDRFSVMTRNLNMRTIFCRKRDGSSCDAP